jgi:antitoxin ParD1/3/4
MSEPSFFIAPDVQPWVETRLADGDYANLAEYLNDLVRRDRDYAAERARLKALIDEGIASGIDPRSADEIFDELLAELAEDPDVRA